MFRGDAKVGEINVIVGRPFILQPSHVNLPPDMRDRGRVGVENRDAFHLDIDRQAGFPALKHLPACRHVEFQNAAAIRVRYQIEVTAWREGSALNARNQQPVSGAVSQFEVVKEVEI